MRYQSIYHPYASVNEMLFYGKDLFFSWQDGAPFITDIPTSGSRRLRYPRIGLYAGRGTSHSWLWFVELFDRLGFLSLDFLDESDVHNGALTGLDVLIMSGGDTFAVARALGEKGAFALRRFIENGGLYIGSCAGAYLPMNSSKPHLNHFNFANVKISNLSKHLPEANRMAHKFCTAYGCGYVFHPVRESVQLKATGHIPFGPVRSIRAPLYGGPGMITENRDDILMWYERFTDKTAFLASEQIAADTLLGKAAAVRTALGKGRMYLLGPHLEHPQYPEANRLVADAIFWDVAYHSKNGTPVGGHTAPASPMPNGKQLIRNLKRELSNSRIVAAGLEMGSHLWQIGAKVYDPGKIRVYLEALWHRTLFLERCPTLYAVSDKAHEILERADRMTILLRRIKTRTDSGLGTTDAASEVFADLHRLASDLLHVYFQTRMQTAGCSKNGFSRSATRYPRQNAYSPIRLSDSIDNAIGCSAGNTPVKKSVAAHAM